MVKLCSTLAQPRLTLMSQAYDPLESAAEGNLER